MKEPMSIEAIRAVWEATTPTSKLGRWFTQNYAQFNELKRPRWLAMAAKFAEEGLIEVPADFWADENTPERQMARRRAGEAARQIWERVKRQQTIAARATRPVTSIPPARSQPPPLPSPSFSTEPVAFEFRTLRRAPLKKQE
jgi:hypothetical protein